ncbi:hypothetical protein [Enterovirga rhinocerotis]|uniref:Uncharacterized protein n=1 Tax=Enterovirga rhinocerotis TaxID=1339210 RepID=A0A4R7BH12_9HYPH|nr:hypothetical protein [Enterovirga rhinocerotis]TDR84564.1 hypothetical protein EV668_4925 [Enterovirga rhinocerotis]
MSTSERPGDGGTQFEAWLAAEFEEGGSFTALIVLVEIGETTVTPLCSTHVNIIGTEVSWGDLVVMFAGAGHDWQGAAFFPRRDRNGRPLDNPTARLLLRELEGRLDEDRLVLNEGHFFDGFGRRMTIEEMTKQ